MKMANSALTSLIRGKHMQEQKRSITNYNIRPGELVCSRVSDVRTMAWTCEKLQPAWSAGEGGPRPPVLSINSSAPPTKITIRLRDIYDPKPQSPKVPVRIRPPGPRPPSAQELSSKPQSDPPTKTIMRRRAQSLPPSAERKKKRRSSQVRFVDSLGLELEEVKVFRAQEHPSVPQHVMFRLLMSSELAFGRSLELSLPYFKPCFPETLSSLPDFQQRLCSQGVGLQQVVCSELGITGTIQVLNLAYEKKVTVHYSFTNWRTQTETAASWLSGGGPGEDPQTDLFRFFLPVPPFILQPGALLEFAVCYSVNGFDHWDNNNGQNYKMSCHSYKVTVPRECEDSMLHFT